MDLTPELVALCERKVEEPGPDPRWLENREIEEFNAGLLAQRPSGPFWIFAYGSLIWKPTFTSVLRKRGIARGWHRSFCLELDRWREVSFRHEFASVRWLTVDTPEGPVKALTFWAGPKGEGILRKLPPANVARVIARACGHLGSNAAYLHNTVLHLEEAGIRDRNLWQLQKLVAQEICAFYGVAKD